jgi:BlaI family transcriptional regulator, penicillinase repressor
MREAPRVPEAELDVLAALRRRGPLLAADLIAELSATRPLSHGSITTLLARLEKKGLVSRRKADVGKAFVYSATPRADRAVRGTVERLVARVFGGDRMVLVAALFESRALDADEVERLERMVADLTAPPRRTKPK